MAPFILLAVLFIGLFVASLLGWTADSRDPDFAVGRLLDCGKAHGSGGEGR